MQHTFVHALLGAALDAAAGLVTSVPLDRGRRQQLTRLFTDTTSAQRELNVLSLFTWAAAALPVTCWPAAPSDARIIRAQQRLQEDLSRPPAIVDLAAELDLHPNAFTRLFRRHCACSPLAWGLRKRVDEACRLLLHSDQSIAVIAQACGFADHRHLGAALRARYGAAPSRFRREHAPAR